MNKKNISIVIVSLLVLVLGFAYYKSNSAGSGPALPPPAPIVINPIKDAPAPPKAVKPLVLIKSDLATGTAPTTTRP